MSIMEFKKIQLSYSKIHGILKNHFLSTGSGKTLIERHLIDRIFHRQENSKIEHFIKTEKIFYR